MFGWVPLGIWIFIGMITFIMFSREILKNGYTYNIYSKIGFILLAIAGAFLVSIKVNFMSYEVDDFIFTVSELLGMILVIYGGYISSEGEKKREVKKQLLKLGIPVLIFIVLWIVLNFTIAD